MISIVSIPHTGTKFLELILLDLGIETRHAHLHSTHPAQNAREWVESGAKVVIPWRDPELARISALNRGEEPRPPEEFAELLSWADRPNVHLFHIAPGSNDAKLFELEKLRRFLGLDEPPETDWEPVNVSKDVTGEKRSYLEKLRDRIVDVCTKRS